VITETATNAGKDGGKGILIHCWWECKLLQPQWKSVWRLLKKLKIDLPMFIATLFTLVKLRKQPKRRSDAEDK
jgi:hypothetical protein